MNLPTGWDSARAGDRNPSPRFAIMSGTDEGDPSVDLVMWVTGSVRQTEAYLAYLTVVAEDILAMTRV